LTLHHPMDAGYADVVLLTFGDPPLDRRDRLTEVDGADPDAQNIHAPSAAQRPLKRRSTTHAQTPAFVDSV